jgi:hypothetical protein
MHSQFLWRSSLENVNFEDRGYGPVLLMWTFGTSFKDGWIDGTHFQNRGQLRNIGRLF